MRNSKQKDKENKNRSFKREQPRKDSSKKRVNFDNTRENKFEKDVEKLLHRNDSNDIRWYSKSPARLEAAARIPFASITGLTQIGENASTRFTVPGVMRLTYTPNYVPNQQVIEQAYQNTYSDIVHANSRNSSYDYTDLAIMMNAGTELFASIALGIRAYGLMRYYMEDNVYNPNVVLRAAGFDAADLRSNYSHMWSDLLQLIAQSRQIWIPNTMPIVERRMWMNLNVYKDSVSTLGQTFLYTPRRFYKYQGFTDTKGGKLVALPTVIDNLKWSTYLSLVQEMIDSLIPDQDRGIMYGDILKAYGSERIFAINDITIDYKTVPSYNPEVLWQIENATLSGGSEVVEMVQSDLHLEQHYSSGFPKLSTDTVVADIIVPDRPLLNFHQPEQPTVQQITIATRLTNAGMRTVPHYTYDTATKAWKASTTSQMAVVPIAAGTEILYSIDILENTVTKSSGATNVVITSMRYNATDTLLKRWICFDWAPSLYDPTSFGKMADATKYVMSYVISEYDNYTYLSIEELQRLHDAVIYSLYNVPTL